MGRQCPGERFDGTPCNSYQYVLPVLRHPRLPRRRVRVAGLRGRLLRPVRDHGGPSAGGGGLRGAKDVDQGNCERSRAGLAHRPALVRRGPAVRRRGRAAAARHGPGGAHTGPARRRAAVDAAARAGLRAGSRRAHRRPGRAEREGRPRGDLPVRLAGRRGRQLGRADLPGPVALPGRLGAEGGPPDQQRAAARGPDRAQRGPATTATGWPRSWPTPRPASAARSTRTS